MTKDKYTVLLVDDSPDDRFFMRIILERSAKFGVVKEARDGQEAIDYLQGEGSFSDRAAVPFPDIVLLDLKMPRKTGFEVLQWVQAHEVGNLMVAIVSGSSLADDIASSLALGAAAYFKKTSLKAEQQKMICEIEKLLDERNKSSIAH
jgi:CheY-like chemotaxis protein